MARNDTRVILWIWTFCLVVFLVSPVSLPEDSRFSLLLSESLLNHGSFDLSPYVSPYVSSRLAKRLHLSDPEPHYYQLVRVQGGITYAYPLGGSILAIPFVAVFDLCGLSVLSHDRQFSIAREILIQKVVAAFLMATLTCIFFATARLLLPTRWSAVIAMGAALGTPIWSSLSRTLWGQTWAVFLTGYLVYRLLQEDMGIRPVNGTTLATLASWIFFSRPTGAIVVISLTAYLLMLRKHLLTQWFVAGLVWLSCFVGLSWVVYGTPMPPYYFGEALLGTSHLTQALLGLLFSPSRGLFIFVPVSLWVVCLVLRNFQKLPHRSLACFAMSICLLQLLVNACDAKWWGGDSYGPRLMADIIPWLVFLAVLACSAELYVRHGSFSPTDVHKSSMGPVVKALGAMALGVGIFMNGAGALSNATVRWNIVPKDVDRHPERVWNWKRPQFLAWAFSDMAGRPESRVGKDLGR